MPSFKSIIDRWRESFGIARHSASGEDSVLRVYLHPPSTPSAKRYLVGELTSDGSRWVFRYDRAYASDDSLPPISAFPRKDEVYESEILWQFFAVRLPPLEREDVKEAVERMGLREADKIHLLGLLSKRAVTSPYEFELFRQAA